MSQYLDRRPDWRWCMEGEDELCGVCPQHHAERRPASLELYLPPPPPLVIDEGNDGDHAGVEGEGERAPRAAGDMVHTGPDAVRRQLMLDREMFDMFESDLMTMRGCCLLCRIKGRRPFDHEANRCSQRSCWQKAKQRTIQSCRKEGRRWMADFTACFMCYLPQTICNRADPEATAEADAARRGRGMEGCRFADMVMPLCYGAFFAPGPRATINKHSRGRFRDEADYMLWLGESTTFGGSPCIQAARLAALLLSELG